MKKTAYFLFSVLLFFYSNNLLMSQQICIVIPAYNEQDRILNMLESYTSYFKKQKDDFEINFLIVANNCCDNTVPICQEFAKKNNEVQVLVTENRGKGRAIKLGFSQALKTPYDYIGFVDADMATSPQEYHNLIKHLKDYDGVIASRYIKGAKITPKRPFVKRLGGSFYNWLMRKKMGLKYKDTQCGAKIFSYDTVSKVTPDMQEIGWAFDLEFLYLCHLEDKNIKEVPTVWNDKPGSHLQINRKLMKEFLASPARIKKQHAQKAQEAAERKPKKK